MRVRVHPRVYFTQYAENNRVPFNAEADSLKVNGPLMTWIDYARADLGDDRMTKSHVASLALSFGVDRPLMEWGMDVDEFGDMSTEILEMEMSGQVRSGSILNPMDTSHCYKTLSTPVWIRAEPQTRQMVDLYASLLRVKEAVVMRHCMAISFCWYNEDAVDGTRFSDAVSKLQPYVDRFKLELESRVEQVGGIAD